MSETPIDFEAIETEAPEEDHDESTYEVAEEVPQDGSLFDLDENTTSDDHETEAIR